MRALVREALELFEECLLNGDFDELFELEKSAAGTQILGEMGKVVPEMLGKSTETLKAMGRQGRKGVKRVTGEGKKAVKGKKRVRKGKVTGGTKQAVGTEQAAETAAKPSFLGRVFGPRIQSLKTRLGIRAAGRAERRAARLEYAEKKTALRQAAKTERLKARQQRRLARLQEKYARGIAKARGITPGVTGGAGAVAGETVGEAAGEIGGTSSRWIIPAAAAGGAAALAGTYALGRTRGSSAYQYPSGY